MRRVALVGVLVACSSPPARHPTAMEGVPPPAVEEPQHVLVPRKGAKTLVIADGPFLCTVDDERLVEVWGTSAAATLIGKKEGHTVMHVARAGKRAIDVAIDVVKAEPNDFAIAVGERVMFASTDVKEWSESGPGIVDVTPSGGSIVVTGRRPGANVVVFVRTDGTSRSVEFTVVGGNRHVPAAGKPSPNAIAMAVGGWKVIPSDRTVRFFDVIPQGVVEVIATPDALGLSVHALSTGTAEVVLIRDEGSESFDFVVTRTDICR